MLKAIENKAADLKVDYKAAADVILRKTADILSEARRAGGGPNSVLSIALKDDAVSEEHIKEVAGLSEVNLCAFFNMLMISRDLQSVAFTAGNDEKKLAVVSAEMVRRSGRPAPRDLVDGILVQPEGARFAIYVRVL